MKTLTVFTPTYNRAHTLTRTYESLCRQTCKDFDWLVVDDGSTDGTKALVDGFMSEGKITVRYIYKENGGLYTGYNTAYANISTPLNVCIDSDDYMPDDAVHKIIKLWQERGSENYAGIVGLDFNADGSGPLGGYFPNSLKECWYVDLRQKYRHNADTKLVLRTDLMKKVSPQIGFPGEKDFNPLYMISKVCDVYPMIVLNENLCFVDYQKDGMSHNVYLHYRRSPRSFAKSRLLDMRLKHNTPLNKFRCAIHYISSCLITKDKDWLRNSPRKLMTICAVPFGILLWILVMYKTRGLEL